MQHRLPAPHPDEQAHSDQLLQCIREEIRTHGPMPFARYMERCLYTPGLGYYSAGSVKFGADGDFVTAPELGSLFAQCVVHAIEPTLHAIGSNADMLELGAGSGAFAEHALRALAALDRVPSRYLILEPSADLRQRQHQRLQASLPAELWARLHWLDTPPEQPWQGVLFANEVIDALPVTRFAVHGTTLYEECVILDDHGQLCCDDRPAETSSAMAIRELEQSLPQRFADGYRSEILPQLPHWIEAVSGRLERGLMLFVDYGYTRRDYYLPDRLDGTLMAHYRHHAHNDPLFLPGLNDLTASVDFSALAAAGRMAGFELGSYLPQSEFLIRAGLQQIFESAYAVAEDVEAYRLAQQVRQLTLPDRMGERFQAMALTRRIHAHDVLTELSRHDYRARL